MPFTLSHAAAALPFRRFDPIWPALVIGTFAPDFEYFIRISDDSRSGHHFPDVLIYTLPLALAVLWVFEHLVKGPVIELLPDSVQRRLQGRIQPLSFMLPARLLAITAWTAVGIATHLLWDSFTHGQSWLTKHWDWPRHVVAFPWHAPITISKLLQHISTLLGMAILVAWFVGWYTSTPPLAGTRGPKLSPRRKALTAFIILTIAIVGGYMVANLRLEDLPVSPLMAVAAMVESTTMILVIELVAYGSIRTYRMRVQSLPVSSS